MKWRRGAQGKYRGVELARVATLARFARRCAGVSVKRVAKRFFFCRGGGVSYECHR